MALGYLAPFRRTRPSLTGGGSPMFDLHRQVNELFDDFFGQEQGNGSDGRFGLAAPAVDLHEDDERLEITAELPGVREEDVDLTVEEGILTLRGQKKSSREDRENGYSERRYGSFERRIALPANVDVEKCSADFENGVLTVTLPKTEQSRARRIPLGGGKGDGQRRVIENNPGKSADTKTKERESA